MKKMFFIGIGLLAVSSLLTACQAEPEVTSCQEIFVDQPQYGSDFYGNIVFRGTRKVTKGWLHWDSNKRCPYSNSYCFRILKQTPSKILKGDYCDHCHLTWALHE